MWRLGYKQQFRELADVTALWFDGKFYLYPSVDMAWVSDDLGATWKHHPLNVRDIGYAPTIVQHKDRFLLMASNAPIYTSRSLDCARMADRHHTLCCRVYCVWQHALVTSASTRLSQAVYRKSYRDIVVGVIARSGSSGAGDSQPTDLAVSVRFQLKS